MRHLSTFDVLSVYILFSKTRGKTFQGGALLRRSVKTLVVQKLFLFLIKYSRKASDRLGWVYRCACVSWWYTYRRTEQTLCRGAVFHGFPKLRGQFSPLPPPPGSYAYGYTLYTKYVHVIQTKRMALHMNPSLSACIAHVQTICREGFCRRRIRPFKRAATLSQWSKRFHFTLLFIIIYCHWKSNKIDQLNIKRRISSQN
jgi:hypothetical protein